MDVERICKAQALGYLQVGYSVPTNMDLRGPTSKGREGTKDGNAGQEKGKKEGRGSTSKARREGRGGIGLAPKIKAKLRPWQ